MQGWSSIPAWLSGHSKKGKDMERLVFQEAEKKKNKSTVVRVSLSNYDRILEISDRTDLSAYAVADKLISYALERVEWEKH